MTVIAFRIYGRDEHRVFVATERERPALEAAGWRVHREERPHKTIMSPPRGQEAGVVGSGNFAYVADEMADRVAEAFKQLPIALAYRWTGPGWARIGCGNILQQAEAERLGLVSDPMALARR